ncbi:MAG: pyridoxamine 5'-phosphate oxidase family protein [Planctomycetota bacterium]
MADREQLNDRDRAFIARQQMFFVATAPRDDGGLINVSPKGLDGTFAVIDDRTVAYLDLTGSGVETIAHLRENGRICVMFCAFDGSPNILRIQGTGDVLEPNAPEFDELRSHFAPIDGVRGIIRVRTRRVADSCGYGVPFYDFQGQRDELTKWVDKKGPEGVLAYQGKKNRRSLDGLPGLASLEDESS